MTALESALIGAEYLGYAVGIAFAGFCGFFTIVGFRHYLKLRKQRSDEVSADEVALNRELDAFVRSINQKGQKAA